MAYCRIIICFFTYFMLVIATVGAKKLCDERKCPRAPITHYLSLRCQPEYETDDCCPVRYNCDHLYDRIGRRHDVCYIYGNQYNLGVKLRFYDSILCEEDCICISNNGFADFECKTRKVCPPYRPSRTDCYQKKPIQECCPTEEICPDDAKGKDTCVIHEDEGDLIYAHGEYIRTKAMLKNNLIAVCQGNKTGPIHSNVFVTITYNLWYDLHAAAGFYNNCAPVYHLDEHGSMGIQRKAWRCQMPGDFILNKPDATKERLTAMHCPERWTACTEHSEPECRLVNPEGPQDITHNYKYRELCRLGQIIMQVGDELKRVPYIDNSCIVCSCEVPPVPTCIVHQYAPCNMARHCSGKDIINGKCHLWDIYNKFFTGKRYHFHNV